jgi:DNA polymerase III subunit chi
MTEVLFYHLEQQPLERILPLLLERCLDRSWRVVVQTGSDERAEALDQLLWAYSDASFLPHGLAREPNSDAQPIILTVGPETPNAATVRFFVDRAAPDDLGGLSRAVLIFDGKDPDALADARVHWKALKAAGHDLSYWQQGEGGRWVKKA